MDVWAIQNAFVALSHALCSIAVYVEWSGHHSQLSTLKSNKNFWDDIITQFKNSWRVECFEKIESCLASLEHCLNDVKSADNSKV